MNVEGSVGGDSYVELEQFVDAALGWRVGVGEAFLGVGGDGSELRELGSRCSGPILPGGDLVEVVSQAVALVSDLVELGVADLFSGVAADHSGLFELQLIETSCE